MKGPLTKPGTVGTGGTPLTRPVGVGQEGSATTGPRLRERLPQLGRSVSSFPLRPSPPLFGSAGW